MSIEYARSYIQKALSVTQLEPPDKDAATGNFEALIGIYMAHCVGGVDGAKDAWQSLKMLRPDLSEFDKPSKLIHADRLKELGMPVFILGNYPLYHKGFNVLVGKSGSGKSFLALDIAGRVATEAVCVYIAGEGTSGYAARWECWKDFHQVQDAELYFYTEALQVMDNPQVWGFFQMLENMGKKPELVIIDTMARSAIGLDENSAKDMGEFIAAVDNIRTALDCAVLVVHHTGKNGDMRGSSALYGAADSVLAQSMQNGVIRVTNNPDFGGKNKYAAAEYDDCFRIMKHASGGFDGGVLVQTEPIAVKPEEETLPDKHQAILEALDGHEHGLPVKLLQEETEIKKATLYRYLAKLQEQELVSYRHERWSITEQGKEALKKSKD
jgi:predicted transcriptional regulator/energy-coupling factor transporter ATP-binding protein EcfA2